MNLKIQSFMDNLVKETPKVIKFNMNSFNCEFEKIEGCIPHDPIVFMERETKQEIEKNVILRFIGSPISFDVIYCHDLNNSASTKLELHSTFPDCILSTISLDSTEQVDEVVLSPNIRFTFKDDLNHIRKEIAFRLLIDENLLPPTEILKSRIHLGTYQTDLKSWLNSRNTEQFYVDWIKVALIMGYVTRKIDVVFFNVHELIEELDHKRENIRWSQMGTDTR
ncbi:hypothetical protein [Paenibacillus ihuae]|uniref:hypothetical protein n=1 Tax=Paenibacillus ihuae TaxID=1232431 RepID=UPI0006D5A8EA|nr:hypothetical protein [Paenibacillus ihuae]